MNDPLFVRGFQRFGDLRRDRDRLVERDRAAHNPLRYVLPSTSSITRACAPVDFFKPVDRGDVGMIQRRECPSLALEPRHALEISRERIGKDFDGDLAAERRVGRSVDLSHPPFADRHSHFVDAETGAGSKCHVYSPPSDQLRITSS